MQELEFIPVEETPLIVEAKSDTEDPEEQDLVAEITDLILAWS